jgi:hypothetical protein
VIVRFEGEMREGDNKSNKQYSNSNNNTNNNTNSGHDHVQGIMIILYFGFQTKTQSLKARIQNDTLVSIFLLFSNDESKCH